MKTPDEIKKGLKACIARKCCGKRHECPYRKESKCIMALSKDALAYINQLEAKLTEHEKPRKPLTWEDAMMYDFWLELEGHGSVYMALNYLAVDTDEDGYILCSTHVDNQLELKRDEYGKRWRAWENNPTDEERKAAKWDD